MKMIKKNTKMTPIEPNFMKILMSFLLQIRARTRKRKIAQWLDEYCSKVGSSRTSGRFPEVQANIESVNGYKS